MTELYDTIGRGYRRFRRPDPRIAGRISEALGGAESVANVGAGAGSYEPGGCRVVAVEPSLTMIRQRALDAAPAVRAVASALPFRDASFDAALAVLTVHHWPDRARGLAELGRAARRRVVILTHDPALTGFWLSDYFPELFEIDPTSFRRSRSCAAARAGLRLRRADSRDCTDGFRAPIGAGPRPIWMVACGSAISSFAKVAPYELAQGLARLAGDLRSGEWERRHGRCARSRASTSATGSSSRRWHEPARLGAHALGLQPLDERTSLRVLRPAPGRGTQARPRRILSLHPRDSQPPATRRPHLVGSLHGRSVRRALARPGAPHGLRRSCAPSASARTAKSTPGPQR